MLTIEVDNFDLGQICRSGQCFRMDQISDDRYRVIAGDKYLELTQEGGTCQFLLPGRGLYLLLDPVFRSGL